MLNSLMVVDGDGPWVEVDRDRSLRRRVTSKVGDSMEVFGEG